VRVCFGTALAVQTKSLAEGCRVPDEPDVSRTATQQFHDEQAILIASDRESGRHDSYAHHHPTRSPALRPDNRNQVCNSPKGAVGEICSLQNFGSVSAAKECAQLELPSCVAGERGSQRITLMTKTISKAGSMIPSPQSSPRTRGGAKRCIGPISQGAF
jgi:hypothetical protein